MPATMPPWAQVHSVYEVCQRVKHLLGHDDLLGQVWVRGEVSNAKASDRGHLYFTLKDDHAQLACVMWSGARRLPFELQDGVGLIVQGKVTMYELRGQTQLVVEEVHPDGHGKLALAFEQLKQRLEQRGYFDPARKRPLPSCPVRVGVVTSTQGAALRDILRVLARRWPCAEVVVRGVRVQGDGAAEEVAAAIRLFNRHAAADVLIVGRGGGSLEDLWAFNEEPVAEAIFGSAIPVISAVGHETDVTIADFVADLRAPTPSAAAEHAVPDRDAQRQHLERLGHGLAARLDARLAHAGRALLALEQRAALRKPGKLLEDWDERLEQGADALVQAVARSLDEAAARLERASALLDSYSPLRTMERGYAIVTSGAGLVTRAAQLAPGARATLHFPDGERDVVVP
jgi:exodeoxyribonuclease VII large subunit